MKMRVVVLLSVCAAVVVLPAVVQAAQIVGWGITNGSFNDKGQVRNTPTDDDYVAVGAGGRISLAVRRDGTIASWGESYGTVPSGTGYVAVAAGAEHAIALHSDGTISA